jgi:uncharacterized protein (DUF608 family)
MERLAAGTAGLAMLGDLACGQDGEEALSLPPLRQAGMQSYPVTPGRVYKGKNLQAVGMPIGGIGTGTIWLDGQGRLAVWQIFNNLGESRIPDSFFAIRARAGGGPDVTRVLQTAAEGPLEPMASLEYEAGYPISRLTFQDPALPVRVSMEAFNPMIPLDAMNSSIPCAIFRISVQNPGPAAAEVTLLAMLQNAVGSRGVAGIQGVRFAEYGDNRNRVLEEKSMVAVAMGKSFKAVPAGKVDVRAATGQKVDGPPLCCLAGLNGLTPGTVERMGQVAAERGVLLAHGVSADFFKNLAALRSEEKTPAAAATVFEDFEKDTYEGWTIGGEAFGKGPSHGTEPGQQPVTGFVGHGLVNTFRGGDGPQGTLTSKPFRIERPYIGFLIGGGKFRGKTCVNLRVGAKPVRSATGRNSETLEPVSWDVSDLKGEQAVIEIVDRESGPWGHICVDQIIFSDVPPEPLLRRGTAAETAVKALELEFSGAEEAALPAGQGVVPTADAPAALRAVAAAWKVASYTRLLGFRAGSHGYRVLAATPSGDPLVIEGPLGKGRIILALAADLPWSWGNELFAAARGEALQPGQRLVPGDPGWGTMALAALEPTAVAVPKWVGAEELAALVADPAKAKGAATEATSGPGETINAALAVPFTLEAGQSRTVTFVIAWHFPNVERFHHSGNLYSRRWPDATAVARYVAEHSLALSLRTRLYQDTLYQSNLPEEFLDAMATQSVILRGPTCFWTEAGYFAGFEGSYGCCPLNCTHVWNYAQSHAWLYPSIGQNMRVSNFITYLHPDGETSHREHEPHGAFIDGQCACIVAAYREYRLSPDRRFLEKIWPGTKKAMDWLIAAIDKPHEGVPHGHQANTYDTEVSGANTFIGSQYLSALAAAEQMALAMDDPESARRWHAIRAAGMKNQNEKLWNGEYYIQIPEPTPARDYDTGCHADQLLGQWWAHILDLGYLYPAERVKSALAAVMKYNFREKLAGFKQMPRRYVEDDEGGLIICTWPHGGRPKSFILYADEAWTGIEYAAAAAMLYEGLIGDARRIVRMARSRYDGRRRNGLNSGPGGNPYNELECGKFYARAMSSWSLLLAAQGIVLEGPKGILGFKPRWQPEDHRSFFTAPEGWGLFIQQRKDAQQTERIEVRHGRLRLKELVFAVPKGVAATAAVTISGRPAAATLEQIGDEVRLLLEQEALVPEGSAVEVTLRWKA